MTSGVMIRPMGKGAVLLLLLGFLAGFLAVYLLVRDRDLGPLVIRDSAAMVGGPDAASMASELDMIRELQLELQNDPRNLTLLSDLANLHLNIQDFPAAIDYFDRALEVAPGNLDLSTDLSTAYYYSGRVDEAFGLLREILGSDPEHPQALFNMGFLLLEERGDEAGAVELWERLLSTNPDHPRADLVRGELDRLRSRVPTGP